MQWRNWVGTKLGTTPKRRNMFLLRNRYNLQRTTRVAGAPGEIRTPDLLLRRQSLYPTELRARVLIKYTLHGHCQFFAALSGTRGRALKVWINREGQDREWQAPRAQNTE